MRLLIIHSDRIEYEAVKAIKGLAEDIEESTGSMEENLTVFVSVEKGDDETSVENAISEIKEISEKVGTTRVMIYPYAHLSKELASPADAVALTDSMKEGLSLRGFEVVKSPFGWYKSFTLKAKGHPLAEWSRTIEPRPKTRDEVKAEVTSRYLVLMPDGTEHEIDPKAPDRSLLADHPDLLAFIDSEYGTPPSEEPPSIKEMMRQELIDYEEAGDPGHFLMYPKGGFIFRALKAWADGIARDLGCLEIDTPIMYNWDLPDIRGQAETFHERHYVVTTPEEKKLVLRFAGDFGLFRMMKRATLSYKTLPIRVYEFSKSFRFEQHGELSGLRRLRAFHMPDIHSFAPTVEDGWSEYMTIYRKYREEMDRMKVPYAVVFRVVEDAYPLDKKKIQTLVEEGGRPVFIELLSKMTHYWAVKNEFQGIDSVKGNCQLATVQLDVVDASRYGINYVDRDGKERGCTICHCSIGSLERWVYIILETALSGEKPELPLWLAPTQIRLIPVNDDYYPLCQMIASTMDGRVDIDGRDEKVGKRVRDAETEWVSMSIVFGEREATSTLLPVRMRDGEVVEMKVEDIVEYLKKNTEKWPNLPIPLPTDVSSRFPFR